MAAAASPRVINRSFPNILSQVSGGGRVVTEQDYKQSRLMSTKLELSQRVTAPVNAQMQVKTLKGSAGVDLAQSQS